MNKCTKPNCDCLDKAEEKAGGPVKSYPCLAITKLDWEKEVVNEKFMTETTIEKCVAASTQYVINCGLEKGTIQYADAKSHFERGIAFGYELAKLELPEIAIWNCVKEITKNKE